MARSKQPDIVIPTPPSEKIAAPPKTKLRAKTRIKHGFGEILQASDYDVLRQVKDGTHRVLWIEPGAELPADFDPVAQGLIENEHYERAY